MIGIVQGKVTELSNSSGHYKPRIEEFRTFVSYLQSKSVMASNCYIYVRSGRDEWQGPISQFGRALRGGGLSPGQRQLQPA
jgi:hypothetical protein